MPRNLSLAAASGKDHNTRASARRSATATAPLRPVYASGTTTVEFILELLAAGWTEAEVLESYPGLTHEDILACIACAAAALKAEKVYAPGV